ncbi:alpha/beta hydrolase [Flavobacterium sp.]|uniref:alpha/beta fold hydrolase n=1 Tax=Flavobacterium sp. TaxID=239 RepID=UPI002BFEFFE9|nr:alpha/beta hydrolase [Flavobacterium sp.]HSD05786.1 alpha/beta hydrolase [Flavobacterium sp.]
MKTVTTGYDLTIEVNDINLSYDDVGEGRIPIIFLHGFPFDKTMWASQVEYLKNSYRLIACDIRGFGKSTDEQTPLNISLFADDLIEFMNKLDIEKAVICGLSMGGYITLNAAKRYPERFEALILCDTQCMADAPEVKEKRIKNIEEIENNGAANFNEAFIKSVFHKDSLIHKKELVENLRNVVFANSNRIIMQGLLALAVRTETCSVLKNINIPTLIICGREDAVTPLEKSEYLNHHIEGSQLKIIENAGHVSNLEQPDQFNECLSEFLMTLGDDHAENWLENQRSFR